MAQMRGCLAPKVSYAKGSSHRGCSGMDVWVRRAFVQGVGMKGGAEGKEDSKAD